MAVQTTRTSPSEGASLPGNERKDAWWTGTLSFFLLFSFFGMWATFRAFQNDFYDSASIATLGSHYLSPFYSPTFKLGFKLGNYNISPALLILVFPLCFRLSCYYYRKSLYRAYLADPLGCAVNEPKPLAAARYKKYRGERALPLLAMNFHRYSFYMAVLILVILWKDTIEAFFFTVDGGTHFGVGFGSLVFLINAILLSLYTFSCHSWRHLIGGGVDCYSCSALTRTKHGVWQKVSFLNERHGTWAMTSLCSVLLADMYVYFITHQQVTDLIFKI